MRQYRASLVCALLLIVGGGIIALVPQAWGQTGAKDKAKEDDRVEWTLIVDLTAKAPGNGTTYVGTKEFKTEDRVIRVKAKLSSASGKGGNMTMTLHKLGRPPKKIPLMKQSRPGEKEVIIPIEPGDYKLEIAVSNVDATATVETGRRK